MDQIQQRRSNLAQLIELAQAVHGWSRRKLSRVLGRDSSRLIPDSGVPKMDLVVGLARVLEWSVADVVDRVWSPEESPVFGSGRVDSFDDLNTHAREAHRVGQYADLVRLARQAYQAADTPDARALACNREVGGWDGMGCYRDALQAAKRGLQERPLSPDIARMLESNLANEYYGLGFFTEARAVAGDVVNRLGASSPKTRRDRLALAFAFFVRGQATRRMFLKSNATDLQSRLEARRDLVTAHSMCATLATELSDLSYSGIANTCWASIIEIDALSATLSASEALATLHDGLAAVVDCSECESGDWLESYGWWCVSGCCVAKRTQAEDWHEYLAIFTNKAHEIAEALGNWSLRERVITLEYSSWDSEPTAARQSWNPVLDEEDVRNIMGSMARFRAFRPLGWRLLKAAGLAK